MSNLVRVTIAIVTVASGLGTEARGQNCPVCLGGGVETDGCKIEVMWGCNTPRTWKPDLQPLYFIDTDAIQDEETGLLSALEDPPELETFGQDLWSLHETYNAIVREVARTEGAVLCDLARDAEQVPEGG